MLLDPKSTAHDVPNPPPAGNTSEDVRLLAEAEATARARHQDAVAVALNLPREFRQQAVSVADSVLQTELDTIFAARRALRII
jgi:hypothetical protein